jgi:hypothetical protein
VAAGWADPLDAAEAEAATDRPGSPSTLPALTVQRWLLPLLLLLRGLRWISPARHHRGWRRRRRRASGGGGGGRRRKWRLWRGISPAPSSHLAAAPPPPGNLVRPAATVHSIENKRQCTSLSLPTLPSFMAITLRESNAERCNWGFLAFGRAAFKKQVTGQTCTATWQGQLLPPLFRRRNLGPLGLGLAHAI